MGNDKPQGKWLLYLEAIPTVDSTGGGECTIAERYVNPLKLKNKEKKLDSLIAPASMQEPALMKRSNRTHTFMEYREKSSSSQEKITTNEAIVPNRVRRDQAMVIRAEKLIDQDGKKTNIVSMVSFQSQI